MNILQLFYLLIPAYIANMTPPIIAKFVRWNTPIDFSCKLGGKPIFGPHKTWRGLISGIITALIAGLLMQAYWPFEFSPLIWAVLTGTGALLGDIVKSFFKRRFDIKSGKSWIPADQIDYTVGALALGSIVYFPGWANALIIIFASAIAHIIVNHIGYYTGIRDVKW